MSSTFSAANKLATLLAAGAVIAVSLTLAVATPASADNRTQQRYDGRARPFLFARDAAALRIGCRVVTPAKLCDRLGAEILQTPEDELIGPIPPGDAPQAVHDVIVKALADGTRGNAADDRVGLDIAADDRASADHCAITDAHTRQQDGGVPDPDIIADDDAVAAAVREEVA